MLKEAIYDPSQLLAAVQAVVAGGSMIDPNVMDALVSASVRQRESPLATLTRREQQVLAHMALDDPDGHQKEEAPPRHILRSGNDDAPGDPEEYAHRQELDDHERSD